MYALVFSILFLMTCAIVLGIWVEVWVRWRKNSTFRRGAMVIGLIVAVMIVILMGMRTYSILQGNLI